MTLIPNRIVRVAIGPPGRNAREWSDLYVKCRVEQVSGRTPNKATIELYNLSKDSIQWVEKPGQVAQILAGETVAGQIFFGDISRKSVVTSWNPPDWVTTIKAADGRRVFRASRFVRAYPAQTTRSQIITDVLAAMGIARGYIDPDIPERTYKAMSAWAGPCREVLSELWAPDEATWSIQNGSLTVLAKGRPMRRRAIEVSFDTGMIGAPKRTDKGIDVQMDLNPQVQPGSVLDLDAEFVRGGYRVVKATHDFDTFGDNWQTSAAGVVY